MSGIDRPTATGKVILLDGAADHKRDVQVGQKRHESDSQDRNDD